MATGVGSGVAVGGGVAVRVGGGVAVGVGGGVAVEVGSGVAVGVGDSVAVGVGDSVAVGVGDSVAVGVGDSVAMRDGIGVAVGAAVDAAVGSGVDGGLPPQAITKTNPPNIREVTNANFSRRFKALDWVMCVAALAREGVPRNPMGWQYKPPYQAGTQPRKTIIARCGPAPVPTLCRLAGHSRRGQIYSTGCRSDRLR